MPTVKNVRANVAMSVAFEEIGALPEFMHEQEFLEYVVQKCKYVLEAQGFTIQNVDLSEITYPQRL